MIILFQSSFSSKIGGPARSLIMLLSVLDASKIRYFSIVHYCDKYPLFERGLIDRAIKYNSLRGMKFGIKSIYHLFHKMLNPDNILWVNGLWDPICLLAIMASILFKSKVLVQPKGALDSPGLSKHKTIKKIIIYFLRKYKSKILFIYTSELEKKSFLCLGLNNVSRFTYYSNLNRSLKDKDFYPSPDSKSLNIVFLSRLDPKKGLLESLLELSHNPPECILRIDIYGDGDSEYVDELKRIKYSRNIQVSFKGWIAEKSLEFYDNYHYFWLPTKYENFGISVLEAISFGCPILTTRESSWENIVEYNCGLIKKDTETWAHFFDRAIEKYSKEALVLRRNALGLAGQFNFHKSQMDLQNIVVKTGIR